MVSNKFRISGLSNLDDVSLCSDYILIEHEDISYRTTLKNITLSTEFDELKTKAIYINGVSLPGFKFKGLGILCSDTLMHDVTEDVDYEALSCAGWIYQVKENGLSNSIYASNGRNWYNCGFVQMNNASYTEYGLVKIGENGGLSIDNGVLCVDFDRFPSLNVDTSSFTSSDNYVPSSKLVYENLLGISSMIEEQLIRLDGIV